eukprot:scaffold54876_cov75-Phaeocystis_antarctica.AAC.4
MISWERPRHRGEATRGEDRWLGPREAPAWCRGARGPGCTVVHRMVLWVAGWNPTNEGLRFRNCPPSDAVTELGASAGRASGRTTLPERFPREKTCVYPARPVGQLGTATPEGYLTTAMAPMLKPVRRGPGSRGA